MKSDNSQGLDHVGSMASHLCFTLSEMGSHWRVMRRGMRGSDLYFKNTPATIQEKAVREER